MTIFTPDSSLTHSPEVLELLQELCGARASDAVIAADLRQAESVMTDLAAQRGRLECQLRASEEALASSGDLPDGPFPEEDDIRDVDRRLRVAKARCQLIGRQLAERRADIERLQKSLSGAFGQFISSRLTEVRGRYRATALSLRDLFAEQMPWLHLAQLAGLKVPAAETAVIVDPEAALGKNELLDSRRMVTSDAAWLEFQRPLHVRLTGLHAEVTAAIGGTKPQREATPTGAAPAAAPTRIGPHALEALALTIEQTGREAVHASPAKGGARPDLAEHGISAGNSQPGPTGMDFERGT